MRSRSSNSKYYGFLVLVLFGLSLDRGYAQDETIKITDIVPHRGGVAEQPQSTLRGYLQNLKDGTSIDVDVRKTGDDPLDIVVIHDRTTARTCDKDYVVANREVKELKTLDAAYWFDPKKDKSYPLRGQGITIPRLEEVFREFKLKKKPGAIIWIDTKDDENYPFAENQKLYDRLIELIGQYDLWDEAHVEVGGIKEAESLRNRDRRVKLGYWSKTADITEVLNYPHISRIGTRPNLAPVVAERIKSAGKKYHANNKRYTKAGIDETLTYSPDCLGTDHYTELINLIDVNAYPSLEIVTPEDGQIYAQGQTIEFMIEVYDANGLSDIQRVEFYVADKLLYTDQVSRKEYTFKWKNMFSGQQWITVAVYDREGFSAKSRMLIQTGSFKIRR